MTANLFSSRDAFAAISGEVHLPRETSAQQAESDRWEQDPEHGRTITFYASHIQDHQDAEVLDVGAGAGKVSFQIALLPSVKTVIAYDRTLQSMEPLISSVCQKIEKNPALEAISFCCAGQPWALPFGSESFDVIICRFSMHHFSDQRGTVREMYRCLKPAGVLLYSDPAMPEHSRSTTHGLYLLREDNFHGYRTYHEMIDLVTANGFCILGARPYDYQRGTLEDYLKAADPAIKEHLIRAWCNMDSQTKNELKWSGSREGTFITYPIIDIAAQKTDK